MLFLFVLSIFAASPLQSPPHCLKQSSLTCMLKAKTASKVKLKEANLYLPENSILELAKDTTLLLQGDFLYQGVGVIQTSYASFKCVDCKAYFHLKEKTLEVMLLSGHMLYKKMGEGEFSLFPKYYKVNIYEVNPVSGKAEESLFQVVELSDFNEIYQDFPTLQSEFKEKKEFYTKILRDQRFLTSQVMRDVANAKIQKHNERLENQKEASRRWQKERREMQQKYLKRSLLIE